MEICYLETTASTQLFLENALKDGRLNAPICVWTLNQTDGIGSRGNSWQGLKGNLAFSFALKLSALPSDLPIQSASLYFGYLFKKTLASYGSLVWLKWPNDLYLDDKKIGGAITKRFGEAIVCGVGLNFIAPSKAFGAIDAVFDPREALKKFLQEAQCAPKWDDVFSGYKLEYPLSRAYQVHLDKGVFSLKDAALEADGSVRVGEERVFSQR
ncbi:MAG: biotin--[acetyl-CoA-carboxylase] ligase [Helicobacteraceae bacterium]|nr:biotin--[acetyl-CoA-carboxylase] ligase [Helicobacteraceae bacterium]